MAGTTVINRYKDLDISLEKNPKTGDIYTLKDIEAVKRSVKLLVLTNIFERPFHPEISSDIYASLFENIDAGFKIRLTRSIKDVINNFEPRAKLIDVNLIESADKNTIEIGIYFSIVNVPNPVSVQINLERVR